MPEHPESRAGYIGELSHELAVMAREEGLDLLAYFLEMASREAEQQENGADRLEVYLIDQ